MQAQQGASVSGRMGERSRGGGGQRGSGCYSLQASSAGGGQAGAQGGYKKKEAHDSGRMEVRQLAIHAHSEMQFRPERICLLGRQTAAGLPLQFSIADVSMRCSTAPLTCHSPSPPPISEAWLSCCACFSALNSSRRRAASSYLRDTGQYRPVQDTGPSAWPH